MPGGCVLQKLLDELHPQQGVPLTETQRFIWGSLGTQSPTAMCFDCHARDEEHSDAQNLVQRLPIFIKKTMYSRVVLLILSMQQIWIPSY